MTLWPVILVRPECRADTALIEHELVHYREQAWIMPVWVLRYMHHQQVYEQAVAQARIDQLHEQVPASLRVHPVRFG